MEHGAAVVAREIQQSRVRIGAGSRQHLDIEELAKRRLTIDLAQHANARDERLAITILGQVAWLDRRCLLRIRRCDREPAARGWMALPYGGGEARVRMQRVAGLVDGQR